MAGVIKWKLFSASLALCVGNSSVTGEFPTQRPVTQSFDVLFDLRLNNWLSKQWWGWWFEMPSRSLWHHCNGKMSVFFIQAATCSSISLKTWGPFHPRLSSWFELDGNLIYSHPNSILIARNFCTCHDSSAVVWCISIISHNRITMKRNLHTIWISMEKVLVT